MSISTKFTYEDLKLIPPDRNRYEIVDGELFVSPAPRPLHQRITGNIFAVLRQHVRQHRLGEVFVAPVDVVLATGTVLEPDVLFVSRSRLHSIGQDNLSGPPDLVAEVISESTKRLDREVKLKQYALYGVSEYWLVDPEGKSVEVFRLKDEGYHQVERLGFGDTLTSPLLSGLQLAVASLWES
jgi:Uma2 family endonuclease